MILSLILTIIRYLILGCIFQLVVLIESKSSKFYETFYFLLRNRYMRRLEFTICITNSFDVIFMTNYFPIIIPKKFPELLPYICSKNLTIFQGAIRKTQSLVFLKVYFLWCLLVWFKSFVSITSIPLIITPIIRTISMVLMILFFNILWRFFYVIIFRNYSVLNITKIYNSLLISSHPSWYFMRNLWTFWWILFKILQIKYLCAPWYSS